MWGQGSNNVDGCSPSYNYHIESGNDDKYCNKKPVGCGAVAAGMVMFKWKFPIESIYGTYDWNNINEILLENDADDCPRLLRDIGEAVNMHYLNSGSWTTVTNMKEGLEEFGYSAEILKKKDWDNYGTAWEDFVRTEIECGRPLIMYGMEGSAINFSKSHYFVIDGYSKTDSHDFNIKYGWRSEDNGYSKLDDTKYTYHNEIIAGISPKIAGHPITYKQISKTISPYCSGSDRNKVWFSVEGADSYHCQVFDRTGKQIWASAGHVKDEKLAVWDGSSLNALEMTDYWLTVVFKNSYGQIETVRTNVTYYPVSEAKVQVMNKNVSPKCPNDENSCLSFSTRYVENWKGKVYDRTDRLIWEGQGTVDDAVVVSWCGRSNFGYNLMYDTYYYSFQFYDICNRPISIDRNVDLYDFACYNESSGITVVESQEIWEYTGSDIYSLGGSFISHISTIDDYNRLPNGVYLVVKSDKTGTVRRKLTHITH